MANGAQTGARVVSAAAGLALAAGLVVLSAAGPAANGVSAPAAAPSTPATVAGEAAIVVSGYVVADGPSASCADAPVTTARVGNSVLACWVVGNTGDVTFERHNIQYVTEPVDSPSGDADAPTEVVATLTPGASLMWSPDGPTTFSETGTWRLSLYWQAIEGADFTGREATAQATVTVEVTSAPEVTLPLSA